MKAKPDFEKKVYKPGGPLQELGGGRQQFTDRTPPKPGAFLQSPGIAHPTKTKGEFGCMGKDGFLDDLKIWKAAPAK